MATFPLNVNVNAIVLKGFGIDTTGGSASIPNYDGGPLYCHAAEIGAGSGQIAITIDEKPPNTFTSASGTISTVQVSYTDTNSNAKTMTWTNVPNNLHYDGNSPLLQHYLIMASDLSTATLAIEKPAAASTAYSLGLVILGTAVTGDKPIGYFVNVPFKTNGATGYSGMKIYWTGGNGSMAGPIGGGVIPPNGP